MTLITSISRVLSCTRRPVSSSLSASRRLHARTAAASLLLLLPLPLLLPLRWSARRLHVSRVSSAAASTAPAVDASAPSSSAASPPTPHQLHQSMIDKLQQTLQPSSLTVEDTSGGCGAFFRIVVASPSFAGLTLIKQHRLVKDAIQHEIALVHGVTIHTKIK